MSLLAVPTSIPTTDVGILGFWFAVFALLMAALSPVLLAAYNRRMLRKDKVIDRERQDEVAKQAATVAEALLESNAKVAEISQQSAEEVASRLAAIHILVNSNLTKAQERELDATRAMLASMREVISMKQDRDLLISPETLEIIQQIEKQIAVMAGNLVHKEQLTKAAEAIMPAGRHASHIHARIEEDR